MEMREKPENSAKPDFTKATASWIQKNLLTEKINVLFQNLWVSVPANFLCATIVFIYLHRISHTNIVLNWYLAVIAISIFRLSSIFYYRYFSKEYSLQLSIFIFGVIISAALWGFSASYLMVEKDLLEQMVIIVIVAGVTAGSVQSLQPNLLASILYVIGVILPLCIWLFLQHGISYIILATAMTAYLLFMLALCVRGYKLFQQSFILRYENVELIENLSVTNAELERSNEKTNLILVQLQQHELEMEHINKMNNMLQICQKSNEASTIINHASEKLFPACSGGLATFDVLTHHLKTAGQWGGEQILKNNFSNEDCWALREGQPYIVNDPTKEIICNHFVSIPQGGYLCLPQIIQAGIVGLLVLNAPKGGVISPYQHKLSITFNDIIKQFLANIRLHELLSEQSIRDPLTYLYNRRYLNEALPRELLRTIRENQHICVSMLDIDFFKNFNDISGHEAGDEVLKLVGKLLIENFRGSDTVYRFGGEEFIIVVTNADLGSALPRMQDIREKIKKMHLFFRGHDLPQITVSIGLAEAPTNGSTMEEIIRVSDIAMYHAKQAGRDRVEIYNPGFEKSNG